MTTVLEVQEFFGFGPRTPRPIPLTPMSDAQFVRACIHCWHSVENASGWHCCHCPGTTKETRFEASLRTM